MTRPAMTDPNRITLYYSPQSRATGTRVLLEELGAPYDLHVLNVKAGEQRKSAYLAINPHGKVPAIRHGDALVTEQVAITIYLADLFPEAGLTPALNDSLRGPYLRWIAYYGSSFEPALIDKFMIRRSVRPARGWPRRSRAWSAPRIGCSVRSKRSCRRGRICSASV